MEILSLVFVLVSLPLLWSGMLNLFYIPLSLVFELRRWRTPTHGNETTALVSIVVPAYNEGRVIVACVESILACPYPNKEIILVNDGSTDDTLAQMQRFCDYENVVIIDKPNGGKASALNAGLARARGEFVFCVDADGIFTPNTIHAMLRAFDSPYVGAVCGSDEPVNLDRPQTHLAAIQSHVGTGFVRRALSLIGCLPIVSGNIGAFRRSALARTGGFRTGLLGEDLELTWRMHRAGYDVRFAPDALVLAEVPSTVRGLWKQRVRWARGFLQTAWLHRDMIGNPRFGPIGPFLALNLFTKVVVPAPPVERPGDAGYSDAFWRCADAVDVAQCADMGRVAANIPHFHLRACARSRLASCPVSVCRDLLGLLLVFAQPGNGARPLSRTATRRATLEQT